MLRNRHLLIFISLVVITAAGLLSKHYRGPGNEWVNHYLGDVLYEIFWCLLIFWLVPRKKTIPIVALLVFILTCILEILQLSRATFLEEIRSNSMGRLLIGTTFSWWDFPHYFLGSFVGWLWLEQIYKLVRIKAKGESTD